MAQRIREIMTTNPVAVGPLTSLTEAARRMRDAEIGDVLVVDDGRLRGLVTDRDLLVRAMADGKDPGQTTVHEGCSDDFVRVGPDDDVARAVDLMRDHALRRLPVTEDERPVGIVSLGDLALERRSALADISAAEANS